MRHVANSAAAEPRHADANCGRAERHIIHRPSCCRSAGTNPPRKICANADPACPYRGLSDDAKIRNAAGANGAVQAPPGDRTTMRIDQAVNIEDLHRMAKRRLPKIAFDFIEGGLEDERGLETNVSAFHKHKLLPRYL